MKKQLQLLVRVVDGGQCYWDAASTLDSLTEEEMHAMLPKSAADKMTVSERKALHEQVRVKFREAADRLFERSLERIR